MRGVLLLLWLLLASFPGYVMAEEDAGQDACAESVAQFQPQAWIGRGAIQAGTASPDGRQIALATARGVWLYDAALTAEQGHLLEAPSTESVQVVRVARGAPLPEVRLMQAFDVAWSPDGRWLAAAYSDGVRLWDAETGEVERYLDALSGARHLAWSQDGRWLAITRITRISEHMDATVYAEVQLVDLETGRGEVLLSNQIKNVARAAWGPDGRLLLLRSFGYTPQQEETDSVYAAQQLVLWEAGSLREITPASERDPLNVVALSWSPDGTRVALNVEGGPGGPVVEIRDARSWELVQRLDGVRAFAWAREGGGAAAARGEELLVLAEDLVAVQARYAYATGWRFWWGSEGRLYLEHELALQILQDGQVHSPLLLHARGLLEASWSPDASLLAVRHNPGFLREYRVLLWGMDGAVRGQILSPELVLEMHWAPQSERLALRHTRSISIWGMDGVQEQLLEADEDGPVALAWAPDETQIAAVTRGGALRVWDVNSGVLVQEVASPDSDLSWSSNYLDSRIQWSENGLRWLVNPRDGRVLIFGLEQREPLARLEAFGYELSRGTPRFLPDGTILFAARGMGATFYRIGEGYEQDVMRLRGDFSRMTFSWEARCYALRIGIYPPTAPGDPGGAVLFGLSSGEVVQIHGLPLEVEDTFRSGAAAWTRDGQRAAVLLRGGVIRVLGLADAGPG